MKQHILLTGDRPTGRLHLGHYVGSLRNRVALQDRDDIKRFVMIADIQALSANIDNPQKVRDNVFEIALDYLAVGIDPSKTAICLQSRIPEIAELAIYFLNLVTVSRLGQNPTVKTEMKEKGFGMNVPAGFFMHPVHQAADILVFRADMVPVGADQLPLIEQANEIGERFNKIYKNIFPKVQGIVPEQGARLMGLDGKAKMSKSLNNAIYLSDSRKEIEKKVMQMYTDPKHVKVSDPGHVQGNVVFSFLDIFDSRVDEVADLKKQYKKGGLGDIVLKKRLIDVLDVLIAPIRERRAHFEKHPQDVLDIVKKGTDVARIIAGETLELVRQAMKIDYY